MSEADWTKPGRHWSRRCFQCRHRHDLPGDAHSRCDVEGRPRISFDTHGIHRGWVIWPINFDPVWLLFCGGYEAKEKTS